MVPLTWMYSILICVQQDCKTCCCMQCVLCDCSSPYYLLCLQGPGLLMSTIICVVWLFRSILLMCVVWLFMSVLLTVCCVTVQVHTTYCVLCDCSGPYYFLCVVWLFRSVLLTVCCVAVQVCTTYCVLCDCSGLYYLLCVVWLFKSILLTVC